MTKFKVGDKVKVRLDLKLGRMYCSADGQYIDSFVCGMEVFCGKIVIISHVNSYNGYNIEGCGFNWEDGMFEDPLEFYIKIL